MTTHDYSEPGWGHDYAVTHVRKGGMEISLTGWGRGISVGDYLLLESQSSEPDANPTTRYRVKEVEYCTNPPDMWFIEAVFAPRTPSRSPR